MLTGIEIRNYRGIREGSVSGFGRVNLLVGPNGSGKSTLLEAIFIGALPVSNPAANHGGKPLLATRHNEHAFPSVDCLFGKRIPAEALVVHDFSGHKTKIQLSAPGGAHGQGVTLGWVVNPHAAPQINLFFAASKLLDIQLLLDRELEERWWTETLNVRGDRKLAGALGRIYGLDIEGFSYSPPFPSLKVLLRDRDYALNVDDLGTGIRIALRLLLACILSRGGAVLAEEIDGYQHVSIFPKLVQELVDLAEENDVQFFLSSHRLETVRTFVKAADRTNVALKIFQTALDKDGRFEAAGFDASEALTLLEGGYDIRRTASAH